MKNTKIYVVISRDFGLIATLLDSNDAEKIRKEQEHNEEMSGSRPYVFMTESILR